MHPHTQAYWQAGRQKGRVLLTVTVTLVTSVDSERQRDRQAGNTHKSPTVDIHTTYLFVLAVYDDQV